MLVRPAHALTFTPSETEWLAWPAYCRARYVVSGAGVSSAFRMRISQAEVSTQEFKVGKEAWYWLHHYCAALVYTSRAAATDDEKTKSNLLREAEANAIGQYQRIGANHSMFPEVAICVAKIYVERNDPETALSFLNEAMVAQPTASSPYALASMIYRNNGQPEQAISVLLQGDSVLDGQSAELHYFLGFMYIDVGELDSAVSHAKRAYELGYPLPGLAAKLRRLGRSL